MVIEFFREIGFDTEMWLDGCREKIFFMQPRLSDETHAKRFDKMGVEAVEEFVKYWENQISVAKDYVKNQCNPNTQEWTT